MTILNKLFQNYRKPSLTLAGNVNYCYSYSISILLIYQINEVLIPDKYGLAKLSIIVVYTSFVLAQCDIMKPLQFYIGIIHKQSSADFNL